jgi:hypothetical protein
MQTLTNTSKSSCTVYVTPIGLRWYVSIICWNVCTLVEHPVDFPVSFILQQPPSRTPSLPEDLRGSIQLTLTYDHAAGILTVRLIEVKLLSACLKSISHNWGIWQIHINGALDCPQGWMKGALEVEGALWREPEGCVKEGSGNGHLSPWVPHWETWKGARILGTLKDEWMRALEIEHLSPRELY